MKPLIIVADGLDKEFFKKLMDHPGLQVHPQPELKRDELKALMSECQGLAVRSATKVDEDLLNSAPKLRYVVRAGAGVDNIDTKQCEKRNIVVANTPGANSNAAAELAVSLMLSTLRKVPQAHSSMTKGEWNKNRFGGNELTNKTVGIVGYGQIGKMVAKRLAGFDVTVLFHDAFTKDPVYSYARAAKNLEEVFRSCDLISLHLPLNPQTKGQIDTRLLSLMQPHAILINTSRGGIVNEQDLYTALKNKNIGAAGFDVFAEEPLAAESPLRTLDNMVLTPHIGASTSESQRRVGEMAAQQLIEYFINNKTLNRVS